jgi:Na+/H+-dicarboxylate symporter
MIAGGEGLKNVAEATDTLPYFTVNIPPLMGVMTALVFAFLTGLGLAATQHKTLLDAVHGFEEIIIKAIKSVVIPVLPIYIFGIFMNMTFVGQVFSILTVFIKIIGIIFVIHIGVLLIQFCIAGGLAAKNPFRLLWNMLPAYFTALGTQSSAATIPVTLEQTRKNGVSEDIAGFTVPLCATIHMSGSTLKIVACALALMIMQDMPYDFWGFFGFICMLGITMVAAPGVPGGAIMASLGLLQSMLGFNEETQALMIALYIAMDSFGTACNVTGDGAIAVIVDRLLGKVK